MQDPDTDLSSALVGLVSHLGCALRQHSTWKLEAQIWFFFCSVAFPWWRGSSLELFGQGLLFVGVWGLARGRRSVWNMILQEIAELTHGLCMLCSVNSYQKLPVRLDQKIKGSACQFVICGWGMVQRLLINEMETQTTQWISHMLITVIPNGSCSCFHRLY